MDDTLTNVDAERAALGAVLLDQQATLETVLTLSPSDFSNVNFRCIFESFAIMAAQDRFIDLFSLAENLRSRNRFESIGGLQALLDLTETTVTSAHAAQHVEMLKDLSGRRRMAQALEISRARIVEGESRERVWSDLSYGLGQEAERKSGVDHIGGDLQPLLEMIERRLDGVERPIPLPWRSVSHALGGGLWPGFYVFVGNTGSGKTQWAVEASLKAAHDGRKVLYLALELDPHELCARFIGAEAAIPWSDFLRGKIAPSAEIIGAMDRLGKLPIFRECGTPMEYGADILQRRAHQHKPDLIVIDFLQLCGATPGEELRISVGRMAYAARQIARKSRCVVLALSSTARANYQAMVSDPKKDPRELVGLGKEAGDIEYASDGVLVLAKDSESKDDPGRRILVVAKQRAGDASRIPMRFLGTRFEDIPEEGAPPPVAPAPVNRQADDDDERMEF